MERDDKCMRVIENDTERHYSVLPSVQKHYSVTNSTGASQPFSANHKTSSEQKSRSSFISDQSQAVKSCLFPSTNAVSAAVDTRSACLVLLEFSLFLSFFLGFFPSFYFFVARAGVSNPWGVLYLLVVESVIKTVLVATAHCIILHIIVVSVVSMVR